MTKVIKKNNVLESNGRTYTIVNVSQIKSANSEISAKMSVAKREFRTKSEISSRSISKMVLNS